MAHLITEYRRSLLDTDAQLDNVRKSAELHQRRFQEQLDILDASLLSLERLVPSEKQEEPRKIRFCLL